MQDATQHDWQAAWEHLIAAREYEIAARESADFWPERHDLRTLNALRNRYLSGERSPELHSALLAVE